MHRIPSSNAHEYERDRGMLWIAVAGLIGAAATVPRLAINYGLDGDCIRGVIAAQTLVADYVYIPSRLPGNPAFEYLLACLSLLNGPLITNGAVLVFFGFAVAGFAVAAEGAAHRTLLVCLFCLTPILLVNAATTIDYIPGLAALIWSYVAARAGRPVVTVLLFGLAVGFRISNALFALPLGFFLFYNSSGMVRSVLYPAIGAAVGFVFYVPIFMRSGLHSLVVPPHSYHGLSYILFTGYKLLMVLGPLATAGIAIMLAVRLPHIFRVTREALRRSDASYVAALAAAIVFVMLFLRHSDESAYLIPAIPFCYLLLDRWLDTRSLFILAALVVSFGVVSIEFKGGESGRRHITVKLQAGILLSDYFDRKELEVLRSGIVTIELPGPAVVLHGYGPMLGFENPGLERIDARTISPDLDVRGIADPQAIHRVSGGATYLVSGMSAANVNTLRREGYRVYYFSESAPSHSMHTWGYDPQEIGLTRLEVLGHNAFYRRR